MAGLGDSGVCSDGLVALHSNDVTQLLTRATVADEERLRAASTAMASQQATEQEALKSRLLNMRAELEGTRHELASLRAAQAAVLTAPVTAPPSAARPPLLASGRQQQQQQARGGGVAHNTELRRGGRK